MDQATIVPNTIVQKFSALVIQGSEDVQTNLKTPLYRQPGYSTKNLELMQLITKPFALDPIVIDSSFEKFSLMISSAQVLMHQWMPKFLENFISPRFNLQLTIVLPGHQFAVLQLGGAYHPTMLDDNTIYYPAALGTYNVPNGSNGPIPYKYNVIRSLNGSFVELSSSPTSLVLRSNIPINYPTNPIDTVNLGNNVFFGGFLVIPIVPIRFSQSLTSVVARPYLNLMDVEFTPWK